MDEYIENKILEVEKRDYNGDMPVQNKATLRDVLRKEEKFEERRQFLEEEGHSHSSVGDKFNMRTYE